MSGFVVESTFRQPREFMERFDRTISEMPYRGPQNREAQYRRELRMLLIHLEHTASYPSKGNPDRWTPLAYETYAERWPLMFGRNREDRGYIRGMDILLGKVPAFAEYAILEQTGYDWWAGRSRSYRIRPEVRQRWYEGIRDLEADLAAYIAAPRYFNMARPLEDQRPASMDHEILIAARRGITVPRHQFKELTRFQHVKARYQSAYSRLEPHTLDLNVILKTIYLLEYTGSYRNPSVDQRRIDMLNQIKIAFRGILARGVVLDESTDQRLITYRPAYRVSLIGGRGFEIGGGFQILPSWLKIAASTQVNFDIRSSQLSILRELFREYRIQSTFFDLWANIDDLASELRIDRRDVKGLLYGLIFNAGRRVAGAYSTSRAVLVRKYGEAHATRAFRRWGEISESFGREVRQALDIHWRSATLGVNMSWANHTGARYSCARRTGRNERKLLAHIIQGYETEYMLNLLEDEGTRVCALEHDGFLGSQTRRAPTLRDNPLVLELKDNDKRQTIRETLFAARTLADMPELETRLR